MTEAKLTPISGHGTFREGQQVAPNGQFVAHQNESRTAGIVTRYVYPPIPDRQFDWSATRGDFDLNCLVGWGRTEREAIDDLLQLEDDLR